VNLVWSTLQTLPHTAHPGQWDSKVRPVTGTWKMLPLSSWWGNLRSMIHDPIWPYCDFISYSYLSSGRCSFTDDVLFRWGLCGVRWCSSCGGTCNLRDMSTFRTSQQSSPHWHPPHGRVRPLPAWDSNLSSTLHWSRKGGHFGDSYGGFHTPAHLFSVLSRIPFTTSLHPCVYFSPVSPDVGFSPTWLWSHQLGTWCAADSSPTASLGGINPGYVGERTYWSGSSWKSTSSGPSKPASRPLRRRMLDKEATSTWILLDPKVEDSTHNLSRICQTPEILGKGVKLSACATDCRTQKTQSPPVPNEWINVI